LIILKLGSVQGEKEMLHLIYIIADDLTGASDAGVQYRRRGLRTLISSEVDLDFLNMLADNYDVISINADTRTQLPNDAYQTTYDLVKLVQLAEPKYIYKKIDSLVRGNAAQELEAVMDALGSTFAVVAISFPTNDRTLCNGILVHNDINGDKTEVDVRRRFADNMKRRVQGIELATIRQGKNAVQSVMEQGHSLGIEVFVADAVTDEDLSIVRDSALALNSKTVFCGSAGLASQLSILEGRDCKEEVLLQVKDGVTIIVVGSRNVCTAEQVLALVDKTGMPVITVLTKEILENEIDKVCSEVLYQADNLITSGYKLLTVAVDTLFIDLKDSSDDFHDNVVDSLKIADTIGIFVKELFKRYPISTILSSGGDTSLAILRSLDAKAIELDLEILPGIPIGRLIGGMAEGLIIITKSGGFGQRDSLIRCIEYLGS
jgi:uncharacterized protein YgbK (DUF1537 family)